MGNRRWIENRWYLHVPTQVNLIVIMSVGSYSILYSGIIEDPTYLQRSIVPLPGEGQEFTSQGKVQSSPSRGRSRVPLPQGKVKSSTPRWRSGVRLPGKGQVFASQVKVKSSPPRGRSRVRLPGESQEFASHTRVRSFIPSRWIVKFLASLLGMLWGHT